MKHKFEERMTRMRKRTCKSLVWAAAWLCLGFGSAAARAQQTQKAPATDESVQASPATTSPKQGADVDGSVQASPEIGPVMKLDGPAFAPRTTLKVTLTQAIDSGKLKNGQHVSAKLSTAVGRYPAGTPAKLSVIATVPAGKLNAAGEFSLELVSVGRSGVYTETQTFRGEPGHKDLPDSAPAIGTDAGLPSGAPLTFHVQEPPAAAKTAPKAGGTTPGSVNGRASGDAPPQGTNGASNGSANKGAANANGKQQTVVPADTTSTPIQGSSPATQHPVNQPR